MATQVASLIALLKLDDSDFKRGVKDAKSNLSGLGGRISSVGANISSMGAKMTVAMAPIALGLGVAINKSKEFDSAMANVNAILGISGQKAKDLRQTLLDYGGTTRAGPQAVAESFYAIVSGVQDASTHMAILDAAVATSEAGQADLMATTSGLISVMNSYGFSADQASYASDVLTRTVGMGVLTMDELVTALPQVTGLANAMGIGLDDTAASLAYLTTQGYSASQSATFLKSMMTSMLNPTADLEAAINALGYESGEAMVAQEGLVGAYNMLKAYGGGSLAGLITSQEALQGAIALTGDAAGQFTTDFKTGIDGATESARAIQNEVAGWDNFNSRLSTVAITVGDRLAPILLNLLEEVVIPLIDNILSWIEDNPELANTIIMVAGAATLLGPILMGLGGIISVIGTGVSVATGAVGLFGSGLSLLLTPIGAVVAALGTLAVAYAKVKELSDQYWAAQALEEQAIASGRITREAAQQNRQNAVAGEIQNAAQSGNMGVAFGLNVIQNLGGFGDTGNAPMNQLPDPSTVTTPQMSFGGPQTLTPRAGGGRVNANQPYMVGEMGPEPFVPDRSGTIIPNDQMGGGGINIQSLTVYANDDAGGRQAARGFKQELELLKRQRG